LNIGSGGASLLPTLPVYPAPKKKRRNQPLRLHSELMLSEVEVSKKVLAEKKYCFGFVLNFS
jgi:hypothetical protein